jgi:hypothetical protein
MDDFPVGVNKNGYVQTTNPHQWVIAQALGIKPEPKLIEIVKKLGIDFTQYNVPPWKEITANPNYANLEKEEKDILKKYLRLEIEYGGYSPQTGRKYNWANYVDEFPEPSQTVK